MLRSLPIAILLLCSAGIVPAGLSAASPQQAQEKQSNAPVSRKSTDPPLPAQGRLGQDLFLAVDHGDLAGVRALLKRGADPNSHNGLLLTPLYIAAASGQTQVMEALLEAGAMLDAASPYGTPLTFAAMTGSVPATRLLLARGASINPARADGITVLMLVSRAGSLEIVKELLRRKAGVHAKDIDGATPLIFAAREGHSDVGDALLAAGARVDDADSRGWTPLMYASVNGHAECVRLLLKHGANLNARETQGRTPLLLAATYGDYPDVIRALLQGAGDQHASEAEKRTAYALAVARGHGECAGLLGDATAAAPDSHRTPTEAVQASLKALQRSMLEFNRRTGCISCHQEGLGRMVTGAALERGFALDPAVERAQSARINGAVNALGPLHALALKDPAAMKNVPLIEIEEVVTGDAFLLAGVAAHRQPATKALGEMAMVVARQQLPEGYWRFSFPRVPMQSSFFTFTALAVRSLQAYGPKADAAEVAERVRRARGWLLTAPAVTGEDRSFRLLGLMWAGVSEQERRKAADALRAEQRPDGGWAQLAALQSDAYATGQALYALRTAGGLPITDPVYQRGVRFLLRTQDEDGSWFVNKRALPINNYFNAGFPHGESQYSSFNGTCWATMALLQTIARPQQQASLLTR
jgi:ankyrin repeat protein